MEKTFLLTSALLAGFTLSTMADGENLLKNGNAENGIENWNNVQVISENPHSGKNAFLVVEQAAVISKDLIPVNNLRTYKLSGYFKSSTQTPAKKLLLGFVPYDENKKPILCQEVNAVQGTDTELVQECMAEDMSIKVKDAGKWIVDDGAAQRMIAFNTDDSGEYKDLPNRNISLFGVEALTKLDNCWEVKLKKPCGRNFPAGTKVREHSAGNTYIYPLIASEIGPEWKEYSAKIYTKAKAAAATTQWWPGTKYVNVLILPLNGKVIFDDITLEEAK